MVIYLDEIIRLTSVSYFNQSLLFIPLFALMQKVEQKNQGAQCSTAFRWAPEPPRNARWPNAVLTSLHNGRL
jgi:hypothetical protein